MVVQPITLSLPTRVEVELGCDKNVFNKMKEYSLGYLTTIKKKHWMDELAYLKLKIQNYLKDRKISVQAAKTLFRWRTRSALFKTNFGNSYPNTACPYCSTEPDSQEHSLQCTIVNQKIEVRGTYSDIFDEDKPYVISETEMKITKLREFVVHQADVMLQDAAD